ncbi:MAG: MATE family efflux transporter [Lachnospiraceae bacterium]|nr:MATE family efflux transporter [Lachnospiraceae bacterium]
MKQKTDMLNGPLKSKIIMFALPLAVTGILQQLFNAADVAVVGRFAGKDAMAAVGSNAPIIALIVNLFVGISLGANVVIANLIGQNDKARIHKAVHTTIVVALLSGIAATIIGELMAAPLLRAMSVPEEVFDMTLLYLRIYLTGMPVILLYNFESAIFRSHGDTSTPLLCLVTSGVINVVLNLFFVIVLKMDVSGVALATIISNLISSVMLFYFLQRGDSLIRVDIHDFGIDKSLLMKMLKIGIPAGLQGVVFSVSNVVIQSAINSLGADIMAASSAAFNIEIFMYYIISSFGQACTTFVGQNYGARKLERCKKVTKTCMAMDAITTLVVSVVLLLLGRVLLGLFNQDPVIIDYGMVRLKFILIPEVINVVIEVMSGCMRGYTYSTIPAVLTFLGVCGIRITWVYTVFRVSPNFQTIMAVYPISWIVTAAAIFIAYLCIRKRIFNE